MKRPKKSKTSKAMQWLRDNPGRTAYAAAKAVDLDLSVLTRALERQRVKAKSEENPTCALCGHQIMLKKQE